MSKLENNLGALWTKQGKKGEFLSGVITIPQDVNPGDELRIVCFKNDHKEGKQPDWHILKQIDREEKAPF